MKTPEEREQWFIETQAMFDRVAAKRKGVERRAGPMIDRLATTLNQMIRSTDTRYIQDDELAAAYRNAYEENRSAGFDYAALIALRALIIAALEIPESELLP